MILSLIYLLGGTIDAPGCDYFCLWWDSVQYIMLLLLLQYLNTPPYTCNIEHNIIVH